MFSYSNFVGIVLIIDNKFFKLNGSHHVTADKNESTMEIIS